jgi:small-conductance mechanosensitive channel
MVYFMVNFVAGILLIIFKPFRIGDLVETAGIADKALSQAKTEGKNCVRV